MKTYPLEFVLKYVQMAEDHPEFNTDFDKEELFDAAYDLWDGARTGEIKKPVSNDGAGGPGFFGRMWNGLKERINPTMTYTRPAPVTPPIYMDRLLHAIGMNETSIVKGDRYNSFQDSGVPAYGGALGKYRVTEGELKSYAPRYLGRAVTRKEFLSSPKLQDEYLTKKAQALNKKGYTAQQIADIHNKGMTNSSDPGTTTYQNPDYVRKFEAVYNNPIN